MKQYNITPSNPIAKLFLTVVCLGVIAFAVFTAWAVGDAFFF
jgi:hypothetical protein